MGAPPPDAARLRPLPLIGARLVEIERVRDAGRHGVAVGVFDRNETATPAPRLPARRTAMPSIEPRHRPFGTLAVSGAGSTYLVKVTSCASRAVSAWTPTLNPARTRPSQSSCAHAGGAVAAAEAMAIARMNEARASVHPHGRPGLRELRPLVARPRRRARRRPEAWLRARRRTASVARAGSERAVEDALHPLDVGQPDAGTVMPDTRLRPPATAR